MKGLGDDPSQEQQQEPEDEQIVECKIYIKHKLKKILYKGMITMIKKDIDKNAEKIFENEVPDHEGYVDRNIKLGYNLNF